VGDQIQIKPRDKNLGKGTTFKMQWTINRKSGIIAASNFSAICVARDDSSTNGHSPDDIVLKPCALITQTGKAGNYFKWNLTQFLVGQDERGTIRPYNSSLCMTAMTCDLTSGNVCNHQSTTPLSANVIQSKDQTVLQNQAYGTFVRLYQCQSPPIPAQLWTQAINCAPNCPPSALWQPGKPKKCNLECDTQACNWDNLACAPTTNLPTAYPSAYPSTAPSQSAPTTSPTQSVPTTSPSFQPSLRPTSASPTQQPSRYPTAPTNALLTSVAPVTSGSPSSMPSASPTASPATPAAAIPFWVWIIVAIGGALVLCCCCFCVPIFPTELTVAAIAVAATASATVTKPVPPGAPAAFKRPLDNPDGEPAAKFSSGPYVDVPLDNESQISFSDAPAPPPPLSSQAPAAAAAAAAAATTALAAKQASSSSTPVVEVPLSDLDESQVSFADAPAAAPVAAATAGAAAAVAASESEKEKSGAEKRGQPSLFWSGSRAEAAEEQEGSEKKIMRQQSAHMQVTKLDPAVKSAVDKRSDALLARMNVAQLQRYIAEKGGAVDATADKAKLLAEAKSLSRGGA